MCAHRDLLLGAAARTESAPNWCRALACIEAVRKAVGEGNEVDARELMALALREAAARQGRVSPNGRV